MDLYSELRTVPKVCGFVILSVIYARYVSYRLRPGLPRFLCLLPVLSFFPFVPMWFTSINFRTTTGFFVAWLCLFKLLLLCFGRGPLDPSVSVITFVSLATLPVKLPPPITDSKKRVSASFNSLSLKYLTTTAIKAALLAGVISLYRFKNEINFYLFLVMLGIHMYLSLEVTLAIAAIIAGAILGMDIEPQFNKPYLSTSLHDFWGHRWNLMVSAILRPSVYEPVRSCMGRGVAVITTFLVSGIMHELMFYYITLLPPNGEVLLFFILHGVCTAVEGWWVKHENWWRPPEILARVGMFVFVAVTGFRFFFPAMLRDGTFDKGSKEIEIMIEALIGA